jgi:hypothetical protein
MKGYYRNPQATAEVMRPGGWLATGDIGRREPGGGALFIEGRLKELIIRSGFNVFPAEVEAVLNAHPDVSQSAVVGRDVGGNEEVVAFVELKPGASATPAALIEFAGRALAPYKRPSEVIVLPSLPAAANGKILKARLRSFARQTHQQLAVANLPGHASARVDHQALARRHLTLEVAANLGDLDVDLAVEGAGLGDLDRAAHHGRLDPPLDHERVAVVDLDALQLDVRTDDELAARGIVDACRDGFRRDRRRRRLGRCRNDRRRGMGCVGRGRNARSQRFAGAHVAAPEKVFSVFHANSLE